MEFINWKSYFTKLLNNWLIIVFACLIGAVLSFVYSRYFVTPMYVSEINMSIGDTKQSSSADMQVMMDTSIVVLQDRMLGEKTSELLRENGYEYSAEYINAVMSYTKIGSSQVLKFSATTDDPKTSELICNAVASKANDVLRNSFGTTTLNPIGVATSPKAPSGPNTSRNVAVGIIMAGVLVCSVLFLHLVLDNTINSEADFKERCNIPVLGVIPSIENLSKGQYGGRYGKKVK